MFECTVEISEESWVAEAGRLLRAIRYRAARLWKYANGAKKHKYGYCFATLCVFVASNVSNRLLEVGKQFWVCCEGTRYRLW